MDPCDRGLVPELDSLYFKYLSALKYLVLSLENSEDVEICQKWIEVLNSAREEHKQYRNYAISLMHGQLTRTGTLSDPFVKVTSIPERFSEVLSLIVEEKSRTQDTLDHSTTRTINMSLAPTDESYFDQIDELSQFMFDMKKQNETLKSQLKITKKELDLIKAKFKRKEAQIENLTRIVSNRTNSSQYHGNYESLDRPENGFVPAYEVVRVLDQVLSFFSKPGGKDTKFDLSILENLLCDSKNDDLRRKRVLYEKQFQNILQSFQPRETSVVSNTTQTDPESARISAHRMKKLIKRLMKSQRDLSQKYDEKVKVIIKENQREIKALALSAASTKIKVLLEVFVKHKLDVMTTTTELEEKFKQIINDLFEKRTVAAV